MSEERRPAQDQLRYARVLGLGTNAGLALLVVLFALYMLGIVGPQVPLERLPELWHHPAVQYLAETGISDGWGWVSLIHRADVLTMVGIVALAFWTIPCLVAVMPLYWASGQRMLLAICVLEVLVMVSAASGLVGGGH